MLLSIHRIDGGYSRSRQGGKCLAIIPYTASSYITTSINALNFQNVYI